MKKKFWAVVDKNNDVLHRNIGQQISVFHRKSLAEFLAYEWATEEAGLRVVEVEIKIITSN